MPFLKRPQYPGQKADDSGEFPVAARRRAKVDYRMAAGPHHVSGRQTDSQRRSNVATLTAYPSMPEIGHPESYYAKIAKHAEHRGDPHAREAAKVGQYVTLALDPNLQWDQKLRYFKHAVSRHCHPPDFADDSCWKFYHDLADIVREHCGREALKLACAEDEAWAKRLAMGQLREKIAPDADYFFQRLIGRDRLCPLWFCSEDWDQLMLIRRQWVTTA